MRSVFGFLRSTSNKEVGRFLDTVYRRDETALNRGVEWVHDVAGLPGERYLTIDFGPHLKGDFEPEEWKALVAVLGEEPDVVVVAEISGRFPGDEQVRQFVKRLLIRFEGVALDDFTNHAWRLEEILGGELVEGHAFFDYRGWHQSDVS